MPLSVRIPGASKRKLPAVPESMWKEGDRFEASDARSGDDQNVLIDKRHKRDLLGQYLLNPPEKKLPLLELERSHLLQEETVDLSFPPGCGRFLGRIPEVHRSRRKENILMLEGELLSIGVEKHQAAFSSGTWLTGTPLTYLAPW